MLKMNFFQLSQKSRRNRFLGHLTLEFKAKATELSTKISDDIL